MYAPIRGWRQAGLLVGCATLLAVTVACGAESPEQLVGTQRETTGTSQATTSPQTFGYTGAVQTFTIPLTVTSIQFTATGASGGNGDSGAQGSYHGGRGGYGAEISGTIAVSPGDTVTIAVGGQGGHYGTNPDNNFGGWGEPSGGAGGVNPENGEPFGGGGGGGATRLAINGSQIALAGGGGGGGAGGNGPFDGTGGDGGASGVPAHSGNAGNGASHGDGGTAGAEVGGVGGVGGTGSGGTDSPGGGGGGGVLGGAGGHGASGAAGGGGAGTCMYASQVSSPSVKYGTALGDGTVTISWTTNP